jgi:hypothetical protein
MNGFEPMSDDVSGGLCVAFCACGPVAQVA